MIRLLAAALALFVGLATSATALCTGNSLMDRLTELDRAEINHAVVMTPYPEGLFWIATRGGREIRLIGTMHIHDPRHDDLMPGVERALDGTELVLLELTAREEAEVQSALIRDPDRLFITDGPTLPELLDEETWGALADAARARQVPAFMAAKFQPWYLSMTLAMPTCAMPDLVAGKRGLDHRIMDLATRRGLPQKALEPWDTLFDLMATGSQEEQLAMLKLSLVPEELQSEMMVSMLNGYFSERIAEVWEVSRVGARMVPGLDPDVADSLFAQMQFDLLVTRNLNWIPVIEEASAEHARITVAVGAAHLPGHAGLLRLLEDEGWTISAMD